MTNFLTGNQRNDVDLSGISFAQKWINFGEIIILVFLAHARVLLKRSLHDFGDLLSGELGDPRTTMDIIDKRVFVDYAL